MEEKNTVPAAIPPAGTEDIPTRKDRRPIIIAVAAVAATVLAVGGVCGYRVYENHRVSLARQACASAVADQSKAVKSYKALLNADATTAALKTDATSVKDAKTLDALKQAVGVETPGMVRCDASDKTGLDEAAAKADKTTKGVKADAKTLESAESSKLDKTVADADGLYSSTDGKVQDEKTREALKQAIAKRDADAIAKAVKAVNDSKAAKDRADAEAAAKAQAEQEAAAQAAAAQQAQQQAQAQRSYSYGSYSSGGWSGSAGGQSYSGGSYSGGSQGGSSSNAGSSSSSASDDIHYDWEDNTGDQYNCQPDKFCPLG